MGPNSLMVVHVDCHASTLLGPRVASVGDVSVRVGTLAVQ